MAFTATAIGRVRVSGVDTNGAFFDPGLVTLTDLAATSGTGTAPVVTSASYNFVAGDVGSYVFIKSGTNWTPGWYEIASVAANAATLTATIGSVRLYAGTNDSVNTVTGCATTASPTGGTWSVDYTQQDTAEASASAGTSNASTTFTDAGALFTAAMVGNALRLASGTNGTVGYYFITAVASTTSITLDRNCSTGAMTNGVWKIGGAAATLSRVVATGNATGDKVVPGNIVYVRGSGSNNPSSADFTYTTYITPENGSLTTGFIRIVGENGRPRYDGSSYDLFLFSGNNCTLENLYIKAGTASNGNILSVGAHVRVINCVLHSNDANINHITEGGYGTFRNNEFIAHATAPTTRTGKYGIIVANYASLIQGNTFYRLGGSGINLGTTNATNVSENIITKCKENGIVAGSGFVTSHISGNTITDNGGDGIQIATSAGVSYVTIYNNLITGHTTSAKAGIRVLTGTAAVNDTLKRIDYNAYYNNTLNVSGLTLAPNELALSSNPFTQADPPTTDWAVGTGVKALGFPAAFQGGVSGVATTSYKDIGAVQRVEPAGGSSNAYVIGG